MTPGSELRNIVKYSQFPAVIIVNVVYTYLLLLAKTIRMVFLVTISFLQIFRNYSLVLSISNLSYFILLL